MSGVLVCGDNCINVILEIPGALRRGSNADVRRSVRRPGGNALVTALVLAGWGVPVAYAGVVGEDQAGNDLLDWMRTAGVDTEAVVRSRKSRVSYAVVDEGERTILDERQPVTWVEAGNRQADAALKTWAGKADLIMIDRYCTDMHGLVIEAVRERRGSGEKPLLAYRTGSRGSPEMRTERSVLPNADICFTKQAFLDATGVGGEPGRGCRSLAQQFGVPVVVATLGEKGAAYYVREVDRRAEESAIIPAGGLDKPATTLGGGDFFRAGFIYATLGGASILEAVRWGNAAAGVHCSRVEEDGLASLLLPPVRLQTEGQ